MAEEGKKQYKWEVRPGGTVTADSVAIKTATSQTGSTSMKHSLAIGKGEGKPTIDASSSSIAHAVNAPKPPQSVGAVDKAQAVRHNASGY
jgi:hypothetical protein